MVSKYLLTRLKKEFLMYRVELKVLFLPNRFYFCSQFLMYRVELKDKLLSDLSRGDIKVPNVPCGVESRLLVCNTHL